GRIAGGFAHCTRPQHGGRAAASTRHSGNDRVDSEVLQAPGEFRERRFLFPAVGAAELAPAHELDAWITRFESCFEQREYFVALEQIIPDLGDSFSCERFQA